MGDEISFTVVRYMNSISRMIPVFSIPYVLYYYLLFAINRV